MDESSKYSDALRQLSLNSEVIQDEGLLEECLPHVPTGVTSPVSPPVSPSVSPPGTREPLNFLVLPSEILLIIVGFLNVKFVTTTLSLVCRRLHNLVTQEGIWKIRIKQRFSGQYPIIPVDDANFNWKYACHELETKHIQWTNYKQTMEYYSLSYGHIASVDAVHLIQNGEICISGSRDRSIQIWDLRGLNRSESTDNANVKSIKAHEGWVWALTSHENMLCSASWDSWLNFWDMGSDFEKVDKVKGNSAFLCPVLRHDVAIAGSYDKQIYIYDRRNGYSLISKLKHHKKPVLCLVADQDYIISGSEDKTIAVYDRRADRLLRKVVMEAFPMSMSYAHGQLWTGLKNGNINILDPTYGKFNVVQSYAVGHTGKITSITNGVGYVITASTDKTIKVLSPNDPISPVVTLDDQKHELTDLHYHTNVLACGCSDFTIGIWRTSSTSNPIQRCGLCEYICCCQSK